MTRVAVDYDRIWCDVRLFNPDILAVQEVDGEEALGWIVDTDVYEVHVDDRPKGELNGQQNTGFAVKRGFTVVRGLTSSRSMSAAMGAYAMAPGSISPTMARRFNSCRCI